MKQSIRVRFTLIFIGLTAFILLATWCINNWWLESFYMMEKIKVLEDAYAWLDEIVVEKAKTGENLADEFEAYGMDSENQSMTVQLLRQYSEKYNTTIVLIDSVAGTAILSSAREGDFLMSKVQRYITGKGVSPDNIIKETENHTVQKSFDKRSASFYLESWGYFSDNKTIFIMSTPLASIRESVQLSNQFLAYLGLAAMLCSSIMMYFATKKITSPILELASLSEKMSELDFEAKYTGSAEDEIGVLGNSMNVLSNKLKGAIGELKSANYELQKDIAEKIQIDEMRKEFIANVSHELKTPIALIQGYAEGLLEGMGEEKESRDYYCEVVMDEANKMNQMVRQLLTLTAIEFGNDAIVLERFDLTDLIAGVVSSAGILMKQKEVTVEFEAANPVYVWADEFKIEEVVMNYVSNALNHVDGERKIAIDIQKESDLVRVSVFNTGEPIPEADIANVWIKFYKVDKARTREYGGSGIGLSIVKAIMDFHHRECGVINREDGVEFWFTLDSERS